MKATPRHLRLIGAASGVGAQDPGCKDGPVAFHRSQAWHELEHHPRIDWGQTLFAPDAPGASEAERIAQLCRRLEEEVAHALADGEFPVVIGGDHSVAIGTWSGVARHVGAPVGLLWIDAHLDSHTPDTSYSGAIHGMPLACLLGRGDKRLLNLGIQGQQVDAAHTVVFGARSYEPEEAEFLARLGVRVIGQEEIEQRGFAAALDDALAIVTAASGGFGVTLDLDALDPSAAPGVGSPEPEGLGPADLLPALARLANHARLLAVEIVEYNPDRDQFGQTAWLLSRLVATLLTPDSTRS